MAKRRDNRAKEKEGPSGHAFYAATAADLTAERMALLDFIRILARTAARADHAADPGESD